MKKLNISALEQKLNAHSEENIASGRVTGAALRVTQQGACVYERYSGVKSPATGEPLTDKALFRMASMTKPLTAVCVLMLVQQGRLSLDDEVSRYLPNFAHMNIGALNENRELVITGPAKTPITVEHLLSHGSGLGCMDVGYRQLGRMTPADKQSLETVVDYISDMALDFEPGSKEHYSATAGFDVLARLVELVSDQPFADFATQNLFLPLGMTNTTFTPTDRQWDALVAMSHFKDGQVETVDMARHIFADFPTTYTCGGAGSVSCLSDYTRFAEILLHDGVHGGVSILTPASIAAMCTPHLPRQSECWGLGVRVNHGGFLSADSGRCLWLERRLRHPFLGRPRKPNHRCVFEKLHV